MLIEPALVFQGATNFIIEKIDSFITQMSGAPISPAEATIMYRAWFCNKVFYGTESISLTKKQSKSINKAWMVPWLHRVGFSSKTNKNIHHMVQEDRGLELFKI